MSVFGVSLYIIAVFISGVFDKALTAVIQTQQTVLAAVGDDAEFSCQLLETKDVLQVTWDKLLSHQEKNLATFDIKMGQTVNPDFRDKMEFKCAGLQKTSMVIMKVTEQDQGCYHCLFKTSEGSLTATTCLQVYELHEPVLDVRESNSTAEWVVSCSATGRPAPTVTLSVSQQDLSFSQYNTVSVSNTNATFTVTTTAVLSGSQRNSTQVGCAARVLSAPQIEVIQIIPDDDDDDDPTLVIGLAVVAVVAVLLVLLVVSRDRILPVISAQLKQQSKTGNLEKKRTPNRLKQDIREIKTPLMNHENEQIRQRASTKKTPKSIHLKVSPSAAKRLFEDDEPN